MKKQQARAGRPFAERRGTEGIYNIHTYICMYLHREDKVSDIGAQGTGRQTGWRPSWRRRRLNMRRKLSVLHTLQEDVELPIHTAAGGIGIVVC